MQLRDQAGVFRFFSLPQVEVYVNRYNQDSGEEIVKMFTYKFRDPFPEGMRQYQLNNGEYVTVHIRQRPSVFEYVSFGASLVTTFVSLFILFDRL